MLWLYKDNQQIGFTRVVTDYSQEALLCDVYIDDIYRIRDWGSFWLK